mmetsp:Transcript_31705/g.90084  ORF Transcript_31705/g.90084 Transcript_31705/m.90084 type:complete len:116 (-) Transcript_31705:422-769(-)
MKLYWAGEERRSKLSDTEWEAALKESATVAGKGERGYKAWKELQDYLEQLNFCEVPEDHPKRPDEEGVQKGEEVKELVHPLAAARDLLLSNNNKRTAEQELDKQGKEILDLAAAR